MFREPSGNVRDACGGLPATTGYACATSSANGFARGHPDRRRGRVDAGAEGDQQRQQTGVPLCDPAPRARHEYVPGHRRHPRQGGNTAAAFALDHKKRRTNSTAPAKISWATLSFSFGGAFLVPYPNRILGEPSSDGKSVVTQWRGHTLSLPANFPSKQPGGRTVAIHGLITQAKVENLQTQTTADGQTVTGVIHAGDFGGHWLSNTDLYLTIALTGNAVDATSRPRT